MFKEKNVVNNVDMSSVWALCQNGPYKTNTQNNTKHAEQQDATYIQNKLFFVHIIGQFKR